MIAVSIKNLLDKFVKEEGITDRYVLCDRVVEYFFRNDEENAEYYLTTAGIKTTDDLLGNIDFYLSKRIEG